MSKLQCWEIPKLSQPSLSPRKRNVPTQGQRKSLTWMDGFESRGLFLESPETFRAYFGWCNSLCIFKTKAPRGTKLCHYLYFYSLYNMWKDQLYRISRSWFYEWLFGPEKFSGLSRNGPQVIFYLIENNQFIVLYFVFFFVFSKKKIRVTTASMLCMDDTFLKEDVLMTFDRVSRGDY